MEISHYKVAIIGASMSSLFHVLSKTEVRSFLSKIPFGIGSVIDSIFNFVILTYPFLISGFITIILTRHVKDYRILLGLFVLFSLILYFGLKAIGLWGV